MNKLIKNFLIAIGFVFVVLTAGCVPNDEYYAEGTSLAVAPMYATDGQYVGTYYQSSTHVRGYWPTYNRPYVQREYYYVW